jgi:hypothetical protein
MIEYVLVMVVGSQLAFATDVRTDEMLIFTKLAVCEQAKVRMEKVAAKVMKENPQFDKSLTPVIECIDRQKTPWADEPTEKKTPMLNEEQFFQYGNKQGDA